MVSDKLITNGFSPGTISDNTGTGEVDVAPANNKTNNKSATKIDWRPDASQPRPTVTVDVNTRERPNGKFAPTSCGALYLNDGAAAFEVDPDTGEPLIDSITGDRLPPLFESNMLCLASVKDVNDDGVIVRDGQRRRGW